MSDDSNVSGGNGKDNKAGGDVVSHETYQKVLNEKKKRDSELAEYRTKLEQYEQEKLEADGKLKEANENLKKLLESAKNEKTELAKKVSDRVLFQQFAREAEKLGCVDVKMAYSALDISDVDVSADLEFDTKKLNEKLNNLAKEKSFLFKSDFKKPNDINPKVVNGNDKVDLSSLNQDQLKNLLKNAK